jgi:hypothetical protein
VAEDSMLVQNPEGWQDCRKCNHDASAGACLQLRRLLTLLITIVWLVQRSILAGEYNPNPNPPSEQTPDDSFGQFLFALW